MQKLSIIAVLVLGAMLSVYGQREYEVSFTDSTTANVIFLDQEYRFIPKSSLEVGLLSFKITNVADMTGASGPFAIDLKYQRFFNDVNDEIEANVYLTPIDAHNFEASRDYSVIPITLEAVYKKSFASNSTFKKKTLNFKRSDSYRVYRLKKVPVLLSQKFYVRGGIFYNQQSYGRFTTISENDQGLTDELNIESVKQTSFFIGISRQKFYNLSYKSEEFGDGKGVLQGALYVDVFYAPLLAASGTHYIGEYPNYELEKVGQLDADDFLAYNRFGMRVGGTRKSTQIRNDKFGFSHSWELAYLPGVNDHFFYLSYKFRLFFLFRKELNNEEYWKLDENLKM